MNSNDNALSIEQLRKQYLADGFSSVRNCYIAKARGSHVWDTNGNDYLDFAGGIAVMNVGHAHPKVTAAVKEQVDRFTHTCFMVLPYASPVLLAEKLCNLIPGPSAKKAFFANSGAEAVENAIKIARRSTGRPGIIAFENSFHGRTLMGMSLTGKVKPYKTGFGPFAPEIYRMPYAYCYRCPFGKNYPACDLACADHLRQMLITHACPETTAAVIAEPVLGEGGFVVPPDDYFPRIKSICEEHGILFIADEIQTGVGRTGTLFAMEHWGVEADITTVAKSLAAGMPLSAVIGKKEIMDDVHPGGIGGTYGANPAACEAALAVLDIMESEDLLTKGAALGKRLMTGLTDLAERFDAVGDVRGLGPMIAVELVKDRKTKEPAPDIAKAIADRCFETGLIVLVCGTYGNVLRFLPPLVTTEEDVNAGIQILGKAFAHVCRG